MILSWPQRIGIVLAVWVVVFVISTAADTDPQPVLLAGLLAMAALLIWLTADLADLVSPARWETWAWSGSRRRGADYRVGVLQRALTDVATRQDAARLHPLLADLVDDRLVAHHGIDRAHDPQRAAEILGDELSRFLADPPPPVAFGNPGFLDRILTRIETL